MNFFKKIDNYLLHYYPSLWVTRVHYFLPIGLGLVLLIYLVNMAIGWSPKEAVSNAEWPIFIMIIPVLIYLVYWFIFQSRYNVVKSGGKMSYGSEYLNFFLYALVFTVAYFFILVVPFSNDQKIKNAISYEELIKDIKALNEGNSIVNQEGAFEPHGSDKFEMWESEFVYDYYLDKVETEYDEGVIILTRREALERIENYVKTYNKYVYNGISDSPAVILADRIAGAQDYDDYDYYDYGYYDTQWEVQSKIDHILDLYQHRYSIWSEPWFWKISFAFIGWLALLVWIFKQMNLRHFVFGFISICLTPLLVAIIGAVLFGLIFSYGSDDAAVKVALYLVLIAYFIVGLLFIRGYLQNKLNQSAYVMSMFFNFWIPLFPLFIYGLIMVNRRYDYYSYYNGYEDRIYLGLTLEELLYWICVFIGIASIAAFKPIYTKFRSLPLQK